MDTDLRGAVLSYNRQEIVRPNATMIPGAVGASDNSRWEARRSRARPPDGQRGKKHPPRRGGRAYQRQNPPPPLPGRFATPGANPLPVGALGFASLPTGYCPLRLPAPGNITIT